MSSRRGGGGCEGAPDSCDTPRIHGLGCLTRSPRPSRSYLDADEDSVTIDGEQIHLTTSVGAASAPEEAPARPPEPGCGSLLAGQAE
jgi:hypothetical protein